MSENTKIQWATHTFNPWEGCVKVSPECDNCYAEFRDNRLHGGENWGKDAFRLYHVDSYWRQPLKWDRDAAKAGERARVFSGSLCDVMEDREDLHAPRKKLAVLIRQTLNLDWLLLTKRPQHFTRFGLLEAEPNIWAGTTVGVRSSLWRIDELRKVPAAVRFLSIEPLLEDIGELDLTGIHQIIVGGESGPDARPMDLDWVWNIKRQCDAAGCAFFMKQLGAFPIWDGCGLLVNNPPCRMVKQVVLGREMFRLYPHDKKGGLIDEFPVDLRVRQFPQAGAER